MEGILVLGIGLGNAAGIELFRDHGFTPVYILSMIVATISLMITVFLYYDEDPRDELKVIIRYSQNGYFATILLKLMALDQRLQI